MSTHGALTEHSRNHGEMPATVTRAVTGCLLSGNHGLPCSRSRVTAATLPIRNQVRGNAPTARNALTCGNAPKLSEPLTEGSLRTPVRKGREGKGREVGHACIVSTGSDRPRFDGSRATRPRRCMRRYAAGIES